MKNGANINVKDDDLNTPLHLIAERGETDDHYIIAKSLIDNGADIYAKNAKNQTPLNLAKNEKSMHKNFHHK